MSVSTVKQVLVKEDETAYLTLMGPEGNAIQAEIRMEGGQLVLYTDREIVVRSFEEWVPK